jgi:osmotically-inducible protein OsmY
MTQTQHRPDTELKNAILEELSWTPSINPTAIGVAVSGGGVTLSGEVDSYPQKLRAAEAVLRVRGVTGLAQEITVRSAFGTVNDTDIARAAAEAIDHAVDVPAGSVKVTVADREVTLSGSVPWHYQHESAARAVRYLKGVHDVINLVTVKPTVSADNIKNAIAAAMMRTAALDARHTTVTTDAAGVVTLSGTVHSWSERHHAEQVAWAAPGVSKVINKLLIKN